MKRLIALGAAAALASTAFAAPLYNSTDYRSDRDVLLEPVPYPYGRARVVTRDSPASPPFLVQGIGPIYTRTPYDRIWGREPGPAWYGAPNRIFAISFARVGELAIPFDPFDNFDEGEVPAELEIARNRWLIEHQMVAAARLVRRVDLVNAERDDAELEARLPKPRATIRIQKSPVEEQPSTDDLPLQARRVAPNKVEIISANLLDDGGNSATIELAVND